MQTADSYIYDFNNVLKECTDTAQLNKSLAEIKTKWRGKERDFDAAATRYTKYWQNLPRKAAKAQ